MVQADSASSNIYQPLDFSFFDIKEVSDILKCEPRIQPGIHWKCPKTKDGKWITKTLKATNNQIEEMTEIPEIVHELFGSAEWITWLDFSCNKITSIPASIRKLTSLKVIYLHGNQIKCFQDVQRLCDLADLRKLTLHGNPVEREKNYFRIVIAILPNLISLDFTGISKADHEASRPFERSGSRGRKRRNQ
ncbi:hypothetical protein T265_05930 [Opisthorchis viverrini]|uniref:Leucine-rich repeat-containing protein 51 n=2 Tax=Opisthorchis viverrini TaxID=6198 RepID=A0A074ZI20_OPIVI|nr:hypothetical protein T265_05930 [Opisthorchis viverrini]KER26953.1 hypothetical protein T265_05930 [Opisthorchis viverrini]